MKTAQMPGGDVHAMDGASYTVCGCYCRPTPARPWIIADRSRDEITCQSCDRKIDAQRRMTA